MLRISLRAQRLLVGALLLVVPAVAAAPVERPTGLLWNWLYLVDLNTGALRQVADGPAGFAHVSGWTPDGRKLILQKSREDDPADLWERDLETGQETDLTNHPEADRGAAFSPDGRWVAFTRGPLVGPTDIWIMRPDGSEQRPLAQDRDGASSPVWSPDGKRIGYLCGRGGGLAQLWIMDADGSHARQVTDDASGRAHPNWSHDGQKMAYVSHAGGVMDLTVVDLRTRERRRITSGPDIEESALWSRDDRQLLVTRTLHNDTQRSDLFVIDAAGKGEARLTQAPGRYSALCWSPDNGRIYLTRDGQLCVMDADGSRLHPIIRQAAKGGYWSPIFSPDLRQAIVGRTGYR